MQQIPIYPPLSTIARITSSGLQRMCRLTATHPEWLATTGRWEALAPSRLVCQPEWATSGMTPMRFISATTALPKSLRPPLAFSAQPSPIVLRRL